jgi:hypothetical protein
MSDIEQAPFTFSEFADNPEPRCACLLLLDTSGSMGGAPIRELNAGLQEGGAVPGCSGDEASRDRDCHLRSGQGSI